MSIVIEERREERREGGREGEGIGDKNTVYVKYLHILY